METPPAEEHFSDATSMQVVGMDDSFFPFISDSLNQFAVSGHSSSKKHFTSRISDHPSDLEADSMPESQMELTEVDVYTQLEHKERDLILAAELGKSLLEKNEELTQENERLTIEYHERLDVLEQEKHELRRKLECKTNECELISHQLHSDINRLQEELDERQAMLVSLEREKSRAIEELSEQNHKLLSQLQRASDAELQLSSQVQQLRKEFLDRTNSTSVRILQLETQNEEIEQHSQTRAELESNFDAMKNETAHLRDELALAIERTHQLERQLHDKERELKRISLELNDAHHSNRQLQVRVDELREEMSSQMYFTNQAYAAVLSWGDVAEIPPPTSYLTRRNISEKIQSYVLQQQNSNVCREGISVTARQGNSSLLAEFEESGVDYSEVITSPSRDNDDLDEEKEFEGSVVDTPKTVFEGLPHDLSLRCYRALLTAVTNCHQHLFELKQEMWESYQRIQSMCTILRTYINSSSEVDDEEEEKKEPPDSLHMINIFGALGNLSNLLHEALHAKEVKGGPDGSVTRMLKEKQTKLMQERDEAVAAKNELEVNLASAKVDLMSVNSQLLEAIQQKLHQQKELEAWQDDMELMIQKGLNERNDLKRMNSLRSQQAANQEQASPKTSWFSFRKSRSTPNDAASVVSSNSSSPTLQSPEPEQKSGRFSWLKRKTQTVQEQATANDPVT